MKMELFGMVADAPATEDLLPGFTLSRFKTAGAEINAAVGGDGPEVPDHCLLFVEIRRRDEQEPPSCPAAS